MSHREVAALHQEGRGQRAFLSPETGVQGCEGSIHQPRYFLINLLPQAQTPLSRQFFTGFLFLYLKSVKAACSGHFFVPCVFGTPGRRK